MDDRLSYDMSFSQPSYLNSSETYLNCLYPNLPFEDETDVKPFETFPFGYPLTDDQTPVNYNESYELVLDEIRQVLKSVCDTHYLPLAQTWSLCCQQGRDGSCQQMQSADCISVIGSASYVYDPNVVPFYEACSQLHLVRGEGIAGKALGTNQPCFATDITGFSTTEYPLADYAKMFGLGGAVAIRLRSTYVGPVDFILEFFLPSDCRKEQEQKQMLSLISCVIQRVSTSLRVLNDDELAERDSSFSVRETDSSSWISHMMEAQQKGESFVVSMGPYKEEPQEFKVINQSGYNEKPLKRIQPDLRPKWRKQPLAARKTDEKKVKPEKNISLPVLQQYFPGSLKDAAKNIGVCPTTLKRICRKHGIMRWPSRKIKKVGHSLKKLQLIIDSVQGAEGSIQLGSFYTNFPELNSPISPKPTTQKTSPCSSSCGSHDSGSNHCCSKEKKKKPVVRTQKDERVDYRHSNEGLVPLAKKRNVLGDEGVFRVKVAYGDLKIRLHVSQDWGFEDLQREIMKRFGIDDMNCVTLKYLDDDSEWVLLTCDADLEECMDINIGTKKCTIKLFLHQSFHLVPGSSFTSNGSF